jgi:hypothetical protein
MKISGWFYLRKDGTLVHTPDVQGIRGAILSMLVMPEILTFWPHDKRDRGTAWRILVEATAGGADRDQIQAMATRAGCDDNDGLTYAKRIGCKISKEGMYWKATRQDWVSREQSPTGYGATVLDAMADLCKSLGYQPSKILQQDFSKLLTNPKKANR